MTDKRVLKTKQALKQTLIEMMKQQSFQKIKVKDLCEKANTSKLTFYTHYDDKYALLQDVVLDMEQEVLEKFLEYQARPSAETELVKHNQDLLKAILFVEDKYSDVFRTAEREKNYSLYMFFYEFVVDTLSDVEKKFSDSIKSKFPLPELTAFLVMGIWGYSYAATKRGTPPEVLTKELLGLATDLSKSDLFTKG